MNSDLRKPCIREKCGEADIFRSGSVRLQGTDTLSCEIKWPNCNTNLSIVILNRTAQGRLATDFYKMVKPFISYKSSQYNNGRIILIKGENIISEPANIVEIFNMYNFSLAQYKHEYDGLNTADFVGMICLLANCLIAV